MVLAQELIPVSKLIDAGIVTILGIAIVVGVFSFFYMIKLSRSLLDNLTKQDVTQDETTTKLVTLTANAIANNDNLRTVLESNTQALDRNTVGYKDLAGALINFKAGIETKLDENTKAIKDLAVEMQTNGKLSIKTFVGVTFPIELSDGSVYVVSIIEENEKIKVKIVKQDVQS